jgi:hypothetical protein
LPEGWTLINDLGTSDSCPISHLYRGLRYGYGQEMIYHPGLDRYVSLWESSSGEETLYSFTKTEYSSPVFITNYAVNSNLERGNVGWHTIREDGKVRNAEVLLGIFNSNGFQSVSDLPIE